MRINRLEDCEKNLSTAAGGKDGRGSSSSLASRKDYFHTMGGLRGHKKCWGKAGTTSPALLRGKNLTAGATPKSKVSLCAGNRSRRKRGVAEGGEDSVHLQCCF